MAQNKMLDLVEKSLNTLELSGSVSKKELKEIETRFNNISKLVQGEESTKEDITQRINKLKENNIGAATLEAVSPRSFNRKKLMIAGITSGILLTATAVAGVSLTSCGKDKVVEAPIVTETVQEEVKTPEIVVESEPIIQEKVLSENLEFDPNSNTELVNRMANFIANALSKGVPVKDIMTDDEIRLAEHNEESLVTIEQLMDFYMVMNIEEIDPMDYARLFYSTKTAETITDNYMYCARVFMTDTLTAKEDTKINYTEIIADKESREAIQTFVDYLARYNSSSDKKSVGNEIKEYIISNYINRDANLYTMSVNEFTYRLMFDADMISNNTILPKDVNIILNEDGKISCDTVKDDGVKDKTERAEEFTSIYNTVEEKLEISREYTSQDLSLVTEDELKTGVQLENEIKELALSMNMRYNPNEKFGFGQNTSSVAAKKGGYANKTYTTFKNGVNVANDELMKYGVNPLSPNAQAQYEANKKAVFEAAAKASSTHTIKDTDNNVVVSGAAVDANQYNNGYSNGYSDGNKKNSRNANSSNASYVAGYNEGYDKGLSDRNALDASYQNQATTTYEDVTDTTVNSNVTIIEQPYTGPITEPSVPTENIVVEPTPVPEPVVDPNSGTVTEFVPIESEGTTTETIETIDYTSSIKNLKNIKLELLAAVDAMEDTNSKQLS